MLQYVTPETLTAVPTTDVTPEMLTQQKYGTAEHSVFPNRNPVCYG